MKKLILLFSMVAISFSADKWEYLEAEHTTMETGYEVFTISKANSLKNMRKKYTFFYQGDLDAGSWDQMNHKGDIYPDMKALNLLGADGWELIQINLDPKFPDTNKYYFKRKLTN